MTEPTRTWYLDRLESELHRVALLEDERERSHPRARIRMRPRGVAAAAVACAVLVAIVVALAALAPRQQERPVAPSPTPSAESSLLRSLDGVYVAELTPAMVRRMPADKTGQRPPAGVWRFAIHGAESTMEISAPESSHQGGWTLTITRATRTRLTFGPDHTCTVRAGRDVEGSIGYAFDGTFIRFSLPRGGCAPTWPLLMAAPWRKA
jgi:hypothetical protein